MKLRTYYLYFCFVGLVGLLPVIQGTEWPSPSLDTEMEISQSYDESLDDSTSCVSNCWAHAANCRNNCIPFSNNSAGNIACISSCNASAQSCAKCCGR